MKFTTDVPMAEPYTLFDEYKDFQASEEGLFLRKDVEEVIENAPRMSNKESLIESIQPADILITGVIKPRFKKSPIWKKLKPVIMAKFQRSIFTSAKLVISDKKLIGYGLSKRDLNPFALYSAGYFIRQLDRAILMRYDGLSDKQANEIVNWALERQEMKYASDQLFKTFWNRLIHIKPFQFLKDGDQNEVDPEDLRDFYTPLICSSIIAFAYKAADLEIKTKQDNLYNVWPVDLVTSPSLYPVGYYDEKHK